jgi:uncharacterized damage-inducible protein DinB
MNELSQALIGSSAHTPPLQIIEALPEALAHTTIPAFNGKAPHTIYQELWHITYWLQITLEWIAHIPTPYPTNPHDAFANPEQTAAEPWDQLRQRFASQIQKAAALTQNETLLAELIQCPSRPAEPTRTMTVREQLISLAAHNAYHFGRIVLLRQLQGAWPPPSGGFTW